VTNAEHPKENASKQAGHPANDQAGTNVDVYPRHFQSFHPTKLDFFLRYEARRNFRKIGNSNLFPDLKFHIGQL